MEQSEFYKNIDDLTILENTDIGFLQKIIREYPYFQTAHVLLLLAMKMQKNPQFKDQLTSSSIRISNRDLLYSILNKDFYPTVNQSGQFVGDESAEEVDHFEPGTPGDKQVEPSADNNDAPEKEQEHNFLKNKNVRRRIKDSMEGMGENISETLSSQIEFSEVKDGDKLQYPPEIYFIDEERTGKNNVITIDASPEKVSESQNNDIFQIDESLEIDEVEDKKDQEKETINQPIKKEKEEPQKNSTYFDINNYADNDVMDNADDNDLIARFISQKPRIKPKEVSDNQKDISQDSTKEDDDLLTETLIKVYIAQGYLEKAIKSYEKLSLKYPEKNSYFANQIKKLKEKLNS